MTVDKFNDTQLEIVGQTAADDLLHLNLWRLLPQVEASQAEEEEFFEEFWTGYSNASVMEKNPHQYKQYKLLKLYMWLMNTIPLPSQRGLQQWRPSSGA